ncbi:MAG: glycosyltransferase family 4 protein [Hungatella sp.]|nr:glycosyltransferase family 4 protein [Hungatella sp.]
MIFKKKNLLIYAHYYVPDTASTGQLIQELSEGMSSQFNITIICVVPSYLGIIEEKYKTKRYYEEDINGIKVWRLRVPEFSKSNKMSRVRNILSYFFGSIHATLKVGKMDYILAISQPPILGGLLGVWGKWIKHAKFIYNIHDFNPEQILATGYSRNQLLIKIMMSLDKFSCRQSDLIVTVGRDLVDTVQSRFKGRKVPNTVMIHNWINEKKIYPVEPDHPKLKDFKCQYGLCDKFIFMYSGNIGLYYDLENLIKVIKKIKPGTMTPDGREVVFIFVGAGSILEKLVQYKEQNHLSHIKFIPYQNKDDLIYSLNAADVHWVVNARGIKGVSCPSKYYGISACSKACLCVLEEGSEVRSIIEEIKGGLCSDPGDYEAVEKNIWWFIKHAGSEKIAEMGKRNRDHLLKYLSCKISINQYIEEISKL